MATGASRGSGAAEGIAERVDSAGRIVRVAAGMVIAALILGALHYGQGIVLPLIVAFLLAFVLNPPVSWLVRQGLPRPAAAAAVLALLLLAIGGFGLLLTAQVRSLALDLPTYQSTILQKLSGLRESVGAPGVFSRALETLEQVQREMVQREASAAQRPVQRVEIAPDPATPWREAMALAGRALEPLAKLGIVLFFVFVALVERRDLRDRLIRLAGGDVHQTTDSMKEAGERVSRYLLMQTVVNVTYGMPLALGLWFIGVPGALLWGSIAAVLRFIPYLGPVIAAVFPLALAFAVDDGWTMLLWVAALILALEVVSNNIVEPLLYGASTGLSAMSLVASAMFWTALWGPVGLVLSTPLTVCILVIGRNLPALGFLDTLLGSTPVLDPPAQIYQRLVADDPEEALDVAHAAVERDGVLGFYDGIGLKVLEIARDGYLLHASAEHRLHLASGLDLMLADLRESHPAPAGGPPRVVCLGGKWEIDRIAAEMLAHALQLEGIGAVAGFAPAAGLRHLPDLDLAGVEVVCLSFFRKDPAVPARHLARRLRARWPGLRVVLALWGAPPGMLEQEAVAQVGADAVVVSMSEAVGRLRQLVAPEAAAEIEEAPAPAKAAERAVAVAASGLLDPAHRPALEALAQRTVDVFDVAAATISVLDAEAERFVARAGRLPGAPLDGDGQLLPARAEDSIGGRVVAGEAAIVVPDIERDPAFAEAALIRRVGGRFYAGAPLRTREGVVIGALCILDAEPRELSEDEAKLLATIAEEVVEATAPAA